MLQIRTEIQNSYVYLDLYQNEPVILSLSFAELQDITKKNSNFSKAFSLPGSKKNNEVFNFFYDLNAIPTTFNPNDKFPATLQWDGYEIMSGHIRLNGVTITNGEIIYQVTFYNQVGDLMANIGDQFLFDLNLSGLSHPYSPSVILESQLDPTLFPLTGTTNYSYQNGKTMWGLYNIGYNYVNSTSGLTQWYQGTSTTSQQIQAGPRQFTVTPTNLPYRVGDPVRLYHDATRFMLGYVTNYDIYSGIMNVEVETTNGTGTHNSWVITYNIPSGATIVDSTSTPLVQFSPFNTSGSTYSPVPPYFDFSGTPVQDYYFKPTIQLRELYYQIVEQAGYQIESDFMDTDYLKKYYIPMKFVDETVYSRNAIPACYSFYNQDIGSLSITPIYVDPTSAITCNSLAWTGTTTYLTIPDDYSGTYLWRFTFTVIPSTYCDGVTDPYLNFYYTDGSQTFPIYQNAICDGNVQTISIDVNIKYSATTNQSLYFDGDYISVSGFTASIVGGPRFIPTGSIIDYALEFPPNDYKQIDFITSVNKYFNFVIVPSYEKPNTLRIEPIIDYIGKGEVLDWTTKVNFKESQNLYPTTSLLNGTLEYEFKLDQDYANQDFKSQANRIFGTDKINLGLEYKDTTTKFDYVFSSPIDITVNNAFVPQITLSSFSKLKQIDKDGQTQQTFVPFKILPRVVFRGPTLPVDNYGFIGGSGTTSGSSTCKSGITINVTTAGYLRYNDCSGVQTYEYVNTGSKTYTSCLDVTTFAIGVPFPILANWTITSSGTTCGGSVITTDYQYWWMEDVQMDRFSNINRFTTYPFCYTGFSHYINFRGEDSTNITPSEYIFDSEDLYNVYYQPYVEDIISEENKIYSCKMYLYPQDVQTLQWNEKILINNTYFRINRITNFNILEPSICDIELIKLTKDYEEHRVLYYDLIPCGSGSTLHSNSDLMYNLYAYAGNYVTLFDDDLNSLGCYGVSVGTYDPLDTYEHYYISSGYTSNLVSVYPDCGCTGRTQFNVVQEEPGVPRLFTYIGTGCTDLETYIFRSSESSLSGGTYSYSITNTATTESLCVYNVQNYFSQVTDWTEQDLFLNCEACEITFITPTPTPTIGATPTPTPTKLLADCLCMQIVITSSAGPEGGIAGSISYSDCYGNYLARAFFSPGTYYQCVQEFGGLPQIVLSDGTGTISIFSSCNTGQCPPDATPTPTPSVTVSPTPSSTVGTTPSNTPSETPTNTPTPNVTPTNTPTPSTTPPSSEQCTSWNITNNSFSEVLWSGIQCGTESSIGGTVQINETVITPCIKDGTLGWSGGIPTISINAIC